jgi:hypothetical protein
VRKRPIVRDKAFASSLQMDRLFMQHMFSPRKATKKMGDKGREGLWAQLDASLVNITMEDFNASSIIATP